MKRKAFTLIEVLITSLILAMVLTGVGTYLVFSTRIISESASQSMAQSYVQRVYGQIQRDVHNGAVIDYISDAHFSVRDIDGTAILCEYKMEDGVLKRSEGAGTSTNFKSISPILNECQSSVLKCSFLQKYGNLMILNISLTINQNGQTIGNSKMSSLIGCRNIVII